MVHALILHFWSGKSKIPTW